MKNPPVRELLANYLGKRRDVVLRRLTALIDESTELKEIHELARTPDYQDALAELLDLLIQNVSNPQDTRCFQFAQQRSLTHFRQTVSATQILRIASLYRHVLLKMVGRQFADDPVPLRRMTDIIEEQINDLELSFTAAYQSARDKQWHISETKYFALFENASEAILSFHPGEGRIIEVNVQAERLMGRPRTELLNSPVVDIFAPEHHDQISWLVNQPGGTSNMHLEDVEVQRADGMNVPISLSCNWINVEGVAVAQTILRDVTQMRQMQRELQNYAEQLEARVAERTQEVQESEERYRTLFLQEQRRARHLSLINDVQQCALVTRDIDEFVHQVAAAVQLHFRECDVTFYLCRNAPQLNESFGGLIEATNPELSERGEGGGACNELIVAAQVGGHGLSQPVGARHPLGVGLPGHAATHGETLYIANDTTIDPRYARVPGVHRDSLSEICVPVTMEGQLIGVISVQSPDKEAFDPRDAVALQTAAIIAASHVQSSRLLQEMQEIKEFNETLVGTMLHSLMVVNQAGVIQIVNERLCQTLGTTREALVNQPINRVFGNHVISKHGLYEVIKDVTENGIAHEVPEVRTWGGDSEVVFDLRLSRVYYRSEAQVVMLLINLTQRWRKAQQLQLMNEMGRLLQSSLDIDRVLHTVLTCITAGPALGFNRAFLLLLDEETDVLEGAMALGPSSAEEASAIWRELGRRELSLQDLLADETAFDAQHPTPLQSRVRDLSINLQNPCLEVLARAVHESRALKVSRAELIAPMELHPADERTRDAILELFTAPELAVAPLVAKSKIVGVVMADNLYSNAPIDDDDVRLLDTVARQAGLTVDNALTYQALQKAQKELVSAERLVAVGEMAARVSHEIRNPLATIGGFARNILKRPENAEEVHRKSSVIVDEVSRLEELLTDLLDMARPRELQLAPNKLNEVVEHALLLADADLKANNTEVEKDLEADLPLALFDRRRLLQALLNTLRNGAQSMPNGGRLHLATKLLKRGEREFFEIEIRDNGVGIPPRAMKQVFDPFFSTKIHGSGLGLAVTLRIIRDHGGDIDVFSEEGVGTTFNMSLPVHRAGPEQKEEE